MFSIWKTWGLCFIKLQLCRQMDDMRMVLWHVSTYLIFFSLTHIFFWKVLLPSGKRSVLSLGPKFLVDPFNFKCFGFGDIFGLPGNAGRSGSSKSTSGCSSFQISMSMMPSFNHLFTLSMISLTVNPTVD